MPAEQNTEQNRTPTIRARYWRARYWDSHLPRRDSHTASPSGLPTGIGMADVGTATRQSRRAIRSTPDLTSLGDSVCLDAFSIVPRLPGCRAAGFAEMHECASRGRIRASMPAPVRVRSPPSPSGGASQANRRFGCVTCPSRHAFTRRLMPDAGAARRRTRKQGIQNSDVSDTFSGLFPMPPLLQLAMLPA